MRNRRNESDQWKRDLLAKIEREGMTHKEAWAKYGVHYNTIANWKKKFETAPHPENKQSVVLVIPDLHCPFEHPDALEFLRAVKKRFMPSVFVCLGDEIDAHAFSRYPKDPDGMSAGQ
jgi:hypothetical protein